MVEVLEAEMKIVMFVGMAMFLFGAWVYYAIGSTNWGNLWMGMAIIMRINAMEAK